jgi:hypothetical protein
LAEFNDCYIFVNTNTGKGAKIAPDDIILDDLKGDNKVFKDLFIKKHIQSMKLKICLKMTWVLVFRLC